MVLVESLQSFAEQAEAIYAASPLKTRYIIKYNHSKGKLTLKVSDDVTTVQFKTDQQSDLRKIERLNSRLIQWMSSGEAPQEEAAEAPAAAPSQQRQKKPAQPQESARSKKARRRA